MEDSEKMTALKKAYAEIILNTAKEAAARIMVSERKAHHYSHDLSTTKDEALRLLLRLKQTMDHKINEAEMKSQDQQRKIEVLEAQLQEAEDIVGSLRAELNEAHMKLDKFAKNQMGHGSNPMDKGDNENGRLQPGNRPSEAILRSQADRINYGSHECSSANKYLEGFGYSREPEVPSIISRRKEPGRYPNGCTQKVKTGDGNLLEGHFSLGGGLDRLENVIVDDSACVKEEEHVDTEETENQDPLNMMQVLKLLKRRRKRGFRYKRHNASLLKHSSQMAKEVRSDVTTTHDYDDMLESDDKLTEVVNEDREVASSLADIKPEMKNSSSLDLDVKILETSDGLSSPPCKDRILKYTFQRKRKRESGDSSLSHEENPLSKKITKKQNGNLEPVKFSEATESSLGGRKMAQVARQSPLYPLPSLLITHILPSKLINHISSNTMIIIYHHWPTLHHLPPHPTPDSPPSTFPSAPPTSTAVTPPPIDPPASATAPPSIVFTAPALSNRIKLLYFGDSLP
ncbi:hypothetical protein KSS87_004876 [Heliosperma pusillum]|nr:hypothetical protein KSS87_004876 [Heliosperma pusillum]